MGIKPIVHQRVKPLETNDWCPCVSWSPNSVTQLLFLPPALFFVFVGFFFSSPISEQRKISTSSASVFGYKTTLAPHFFSGPTFQR